jgi:hypothetical protein
LLSNAIAPGTPITGTPRLIPMLMPASAGADANNAPPAIAAATAATFTTPFI